MIILSGLHLLEGVRFALQLLCEAGNFLLGGCQGSRLLARCLQACACAGAAVSAACAGTHVYSVLFCVDARALCVYVIIHVCACACVLMSSLATNLFFSLQLCCLATHPRTVPHPTLSKKKQPLPTFAQCVPSDTIPTNDTSKHNSHNATHTSFVKLTDTRTIHQNSYQHTHTKTHYTRI